ncbi:DUF5060 domain-containing protein [uncultured Draconibacterium sp.]|uniref:DUF5060 domain-containing protein n=1 Tax=uncultured Draconibacterium sp. TaxID=1573823 RepID=UPI00325FE16A
MKVKLTILLTCICWQVFSGFAQNFSNPIVENNVVFEEEKGMMAVEAEYYFKQSKTDVRQWYRTSKNEQANVGRDEDASHCKDAGNNAYVEILPDTRVTHGDKLTAGENFSNTAGEMAILHYKVKINNPGRYYVWVRAYSSGSEDNGIHVGINGTWPETGQRMQWCEGKNNWRWESKQRTEKNHCGEAYKIYLDIDEAGEHEIMFSMREDGFEFDRFLLTNEKEYIPQGIGPAVKIAAGKLPEPYLEVSENPVSKKSFLYAVETAVKGVKLIRASAFPLEGTDFYSDKNGQWLAVNPEEHKKASSTVRYNGPEGNRDILFLAVGENDGNSTYTILVNDKEVGNFTAPPSKNSFEEGARYMGLFGNIALKKEDKITVVAEVGSNDGQEFSRGRWSGVAFAPVGQGAAAMVAIGDAGSIGNAGPMANKNSKLPNVTPEITGELKKWHKVTLTFDGPETAEDAKFNPFVNYRFNVLFTHAESGDEYKVPGYFAADGNAAETSAKAGNKWRVHFAPPKTGKWSYKVDFRKGNFAAIAYKKDKGQSGGFMDTSEGEFTIAESDKTGNDNRAKGRLQYDGTRYLKYAETGKPMFKVGPDAPENFLAYVDFDGDAASDGHKDNLMKTWDAHEKDWKEGDPVWQGNKGKAIVGAVNYLASKGLNVFSFLTNNIAGDDQNVYPYVDYDTYDRFDCSKLDQWELVFEHADKLGMFLHFKTLEFENQGLLDNGAIGANTKLYYRELMARFGHHLALNWNIGEEIGDWANPPTPPMETAQRLAAAEYFYEHDPYHHHVVIHNGVPFYDILGSESHYSGISLQTNKADFSRVHTQVLHWLNESEKAGKQWAVACDEPGDAQHSLVPDAEDPSHDNARINGLWGTFMAGGWGTEWYFGYKHAHSDLTCQDYRSRDLFWNQCKYLRDFFEGNDIPVETTKNHDELVAEGDYCLASEGEMYIVFLRNGKGTLNLENISGEFTLQWFDPRNGGPLQHGKIKKITAGSKQELSGAPSDENKDWVMLLRRH